jgi:hypothetical protein
MLLASAADRVRLYRRTDMTRRLSAPVVLTALVLAGTAAWNAAADQQKGRYKQEGEACVWDANDSGPDQCTPRVAGRFKKSGDACVWDAKDKGPDQCQPPSGRWKTDGDRCVWDPKDSGPNQCNPRERRRERE